MRKMNRTSSPRVRLSRFRYVCIALLLVGIVFRFVNLERKVYWHDEAYTSMEITAHTRSEVVADLFTEKSVTPGDLLAYQQLDSSRTLGDMITAMGREDVQHPPLYYMLSRFWAQLWSSTSPLVTRSISAILSLLILPLIYWLCIELFDSSLTGWIAVALVAISPFQVLYAQEAREYSFWGATILLSSIMLLRAMRVSNRVNWAMYAVSLIIAFYTFMFSGLVAIGHGLYVVFNERVDALSIAGIRFSKRAIAYLIASLVAVIAFIPWLYFLVVHFENLQTTTEWATVSLPYLILLKLWTVNFSRVFIDFDFNPFAENDFWAYLLMLPILILEIYALYFVCRHTPKRTWLFIVTLIGVTALGLLLPDLILGGQRSGTTRYLIPSYLGIQMAVAYLIARCLEAKTFSRRQFWQVIAIALATIGIASCTLSAVSDTWWNKVVSYDHPKIARMINTSDRPVLITDAYGVNPVNAIALSYLLNPDTSLILLPEVGKSLIIPEVSDSFTDIFLLNLPDVFRTPFETKYGGKAVPVIGDLWKLER
ncbi:MAG: glycosyltransferase family 39 protein [Oculatellaceae cyanobacterium bins.114]|nr:glycosyltransferase family 39 protein [Oculatellaceae cyanobacterium bins.114]